MGVTISANQDNSDTVEIKLTPPAEHRQNLNTKDVTITRKNGRKLHIKISGLTKTYETGKINQGSSSH